MRAAWWREPRACRHFPVGSRSGQVFEIVKKLPPSRICRQMCAAFSGPLAPPPRFPEIDQQVI